MEKETPSYTSGNRSSVWDTEEHPFILKKLLAEPMAIEIPLHMQNPCILNKNLNVEQLMIMWHVDNLQEAHDDDNEITKIEEYFKRIYGKVMLLQESIHEYLLHDVRL